MWAWTGHAQGRRRDPEPPAQVVSIAANFGPVRVKASPATVRIGHHLVRARVVRGRFHLDQVIDLGLTRIRVAIAATVAAVAASRSAGVGSCGPSASGSRGGRYLLQERGDTGLSERGALGTCDHGEVLLPLADLFAIAALSGAATVDVGSVLSCQAGRARLLPVAAMAAGARLGPVRADVGSLMPPRPKFGSRPGTSVGALMGITRGVQVTRAAGRRGGICTAGAGSAAAPAVTGYRPVRSENQRLPSSSPKASASWRTISRPWPRPGGAAMRGGTSPWSMTSTRIQVLPVLTLTRTTPRGGGKPSTRWRW